MSQFSPHRARKRFGQHFLHDANVIANIIDAIDPVPGQPLVEVGPGLGALTLPLLAECERLHVVELDRDVIPRLEAACEGRGELIVHQGDALSYDFGALATELGKPLRLVGNLPYNISTPLLLMTLEQAIEWIGDDEYVEVTPNFIRLRKKILDQNERNRASKKKVSAEE